LFYIPRRQLTRIHDHKNVTKASALTNKTYSGTKPPTATGGRVGLGCYWVLALQTATLQTKAITVSETGTGMEVDLKLKHRPK
jgi:hypothetical protein